jgi:DNA (cytosine-5)-methyltransferase 1
VPEVRKDVSAVITAYEEVLANMWAAHEQPRSRTALTVISLFAGCGGSSLGYSAQGFRELLAVERDTHAADTLALNFPHLRVYRDDVKKLTVAECQKLTGLKRGELDVLDGSPPCQGFSTIGKRQINDTRNQLFREFVRLLAGLQPKAFVVENVPGLVSGRMRLIFRDMLKELKTAAPGYHVTAKILDAQFYGVPQSRRRVIVLGRRKDVGPALVHPPRLTTPLPIQDAVIGVVSGEPIPLSPVNQRIWRHAGIGQRGCDLKLSWKDAKTTSHFSHVRLNPYQVAPTLTKEGSWNFLHWSEPRCLSIAEAKRLASIPDQFEIAAGAYGQQFGRIGNCVPPLLMSAIAAAVKEQLGHPMEKRQPHEAGKERAH